MAADIKDVLLISHCCIPFYNIYLPKRGHIAPSDITAAKLSSQRYCKRSSVRLFYYRIQTLEFLNTNFDVLDDLPR